MGTMNNIWPRESAGNGRYSQGGPCEWFIPHFCDSAGLRDKDKQINDLRPVMQSGQDAGLELLASRL
jgi:hypothetical protein